jgi:hypothetical protein
MGISAMNRRQCGRNVPFAEVLANHGFAQPIRVQQELGNVLRLLPRNKSRLNEELYTLYRKLADRNNR